MTEMKKFFNGAFTLIILFTALTACREDSLSGSEFVEPFEIHITYPPLGETVAYSEPLKITMVNNTEQFTYTFTTDLWGKVSPEKLMPGQYTVNVSGSLTAEEASLVMETPSEGAVSITGFATDVNLSAGAGNTMDGIALHIIQGKPLILKELYYAGSPTPNNGRYRNDNFFSVYNNSSEAVSIDNLYIGFVENYTGLDAPGPLWEGETQGDFSNVYVQSAWKVVAGEGPTMVAPGQTIVIASMGAPHNTDNYNLLSPVDLTEADYEAWSVDPENTYPDFEAANMRLAFWPDYGYLWRMGVFGQGIVLIEATEEEFAAFEQVELPESMWAPGESDLYWLCKKVPLSFVTDAVDLIQNSTSTIAKRFPPQLDAGYATTASTYTGVSLIRKVQSDFGGVKKYLDTNNSTEDFEINTAPLSK
jgi:hypothetical protein